MSSRIVWVMGGLLLWGCGAQAADPATSPLGPFGEAGSVSAGASGTGASEMMAGGLGAHVTPSTSGTSAGSDPGATDAIDAGMDEAQRDAALPPQASDESVPARPADLEHTFEALRIAAGEEQTGVCQSWTLDNDGPLFVNRVVSRNRGGFHHSNWIWVDDQSYTGPDGTWPCADRGFEQILAGAVGGVFFAQSTGATSDVQAFPAGVAFELPAHVRIIGDVHLLNAGESEQETDLHFDLYTLPEAAVRVRLQPMAFTNTALEIAAASDSSARMQCATPQPDFDIYYVLPHFHSTGLGMRIDVAGGAMDGATVFQSKGAYGDPLGQTFDPPIAVRGAEALAMTCEYRNPSEAALGYGDGDQEMCVTLIYSSGAKAGGTAVTNLSVEDRGGVHTTDALCVSVGAP